MYKETKEICELFDFAGEPQAISPCGNGHINSTFSFFAEGKKYILQRLNGTVFESPIHIMDNISAVTKHLREKITARGGNPERETLTVVLTKTGESCAVLQNGEVWRMYVFIDNSICFDRPESAEMFESAGYAFGDFQKMLSDFDAKILYEIIPDFHDTKKRADNLFKAVKKDIQGRASDVEEEIEFVRRRYAECAVITDALACGEIPTRVTHNDTKLNNLLFDAESKRALAVIDLDTVMSGSLLYDFGDAIRFGAATVSEDETDLDRVRLDTEMYAAYTRGYLKALSSSITERERELLPLSAKLMTLECGIRFLTDYIEGDTYFKIDHPTHNLDRARNQFKLVEEIEKNMPLLADL